MAVSDPRRTVFGPGRRCVAAWMAVAAVMAIAALVIAWRMRRGELAGMAPLVEQTILAVRVTDGPGGPPLGARLLLFDEADRPLHIGTLDYLDGPRQATGYCLLAGGAVGTWDGIVLPWGGADLPVGLDGCDPSPAIPPGRYRAWAWRGVEYELWRGEVDLRPGRGRVALDIALERVFTPTGTLAADLHVHAQASNDSGVPNEIRVMTQVVAGVQVIGLSDHNANGDLDEEITALGLDAQVASIAANELTSDYAHVNVYPVWVDRQQVAGGAPAAADIEPLLPEQLLEVADRFLGEPIVQINHPRMISTALFDVTGWDGVTWPPPFPLSFDAVEVLSGHNAFNVDGDRRIDRCVADFYTMIDHGFLVTAVGNSDTHHLNGILDALTRNYVYVDEPTTEPFDEAAFVAAIRARRVVTTSGPWLDVEVSSAETDRATVGAGQTLVARDGAVWLSLELDQSSFVRADEVRVTVGRATGPRLVRTLAVPPGARHFTWSGAIPVGAADTWLGVDAGGEQPLPVELTGSYQIEKGRDGVTPFALINPILIDADGDGHWRRGGADVALSR